MTKPAPISRTPIVAKFHRLGLWVLLLIVVLAVAIDGIFDYRLTLAKGLVAGASLCYLMHSVFTLLAHRSAYHNKGRTRAGNQMMTDMYLAVVAKWLVGISGFVLIFVFLKGIVLWAVFVGFLLMQAMIALILYRLGKKI